MGGLSTSSDSRQRPLTKPSSGFLLCRVALSPQSPDQVRDKGGAYPPHPTSAAYDRNPTLAPGDSVGFLSYAALVE